MTGTWMVAKEAGKKNKEIGAEKRNVIGIHLQQHGILQRREPLGVTTAANSSIIY